MEKIIEIIYKKEPRTLQISCGDKVFDAAQIENLPLEQWISPFFAKGVRWRGLYEEMKIFTGSESFTLRFDSDDDSFAIVKRALAAMPVKLVGMNNTVTIVYRENPVTTKIVINGHIFDTALIRNRYIDEWLHPFQIRENHWDGIFKELEAETMRGMAENLMMKQSGLILNPNGGITASLNRTIFRMICSVI